MRSPSAKEKSVKILLTAGGTGGPVAPLFAVAEQIKLREPGARFLLIGTAAGPEKSMAAQQKIAFVAIPAGKWRRYMSLKNLASPFQVLAGFYQALKIIRQFRPVCAIGSGSFVQVPVLWAAWFLGVPVLIHQQDVKVSLANVLCAPIASVISLTFAQSRLAFRQHGGFFKPAKEDKIIFTGNPARRQIRTLDRTKALISFGFKSDWPTLLVIGGGTGACALNNLIVKALPELLRSFQILHITGQGKSLSDDAPNYRQFEFAQNMGVLYSAADFVLARAGLSTITELSILGKVSVVVPIPESQQEDNALLLYQKKAAVVLDQKQLSAGLLLKILRRLDFNQALRQSLAKNISALMPKHAALKLAAIVLSLCEEKPQ